MNKVARNTPRIKNDTRTRAATTYSSFRFIIRINTMYNPTGNSILKTFFSKRFQSMPGRVLLLSEFKDIQAEKAVRIERRLHKAGRNKLRNRKRVEVKDRQARPCFFCTSRRMSDQLL